MMQMFQYPQGEGGQSGPQCECEPYMARRYVNFFSLHLPPLLSRFIRSLHPQATVSMGGTFYGD